MHYILIVDGEENQRDTVKQTANNLNTILPEINIFWCYRSDERYKCKQYISERNELEFASLPSQAATLVLWHYRDCEYRFSIEPTITVGFGAKGGEPNVNPNIPFHIEQPLGVSNRLAALNSHDLKKLFDWACDENRSGTNLPKLISPSYDPALLALQLLCQGYLKVYDRSQTTNEKGIDLNWWVAPFANLNNMQSYFAKYIEATNNPVGELVKIIQQTDFTSPTEQQNLKKLCLQIKKLKG